MKLAKSVFECLFLITIIIVSIGLVGIWLPMPLPINGGLIYLAIFYLSYLIWKRAYNSHTGDKKTLVLIASFTYLPAFGVAVFLTLLIPSPQEFDASRIEGIDEPLKIQSAHQAYEVIGDDIRNHCERTTISQFIALRD